MNIELTYNQIRNLSGIEDDDELNAACDCEDCEELSEKVCSELRKICGCRIFDATFNQDQVWQMLKEKFGFVFKEADKEQESYVLENSGFLLHIIPNWWFPCTSEIFKLRNLHVNKK